MGDWYDPPGSDAEKLRYSYHAAESGSMSQLQLQRIYFMPGFNEVYTSNETIRVFNMMVPVELFYLTHETANNSIPNCGLHPSLVSYCQDVEDTIWPKLVITTPISAYLTLPDPPLLLQLGDTSEILASGQVVATSLPFLKKCRAIQAQTALSHHQPILWKLNTARHYSKISLLQRLDIPWSNKTNQAVFRGSLTGMKKKEYAATNISNYHDSDINACLALQRCQLVWQYNNASEVNARLTNTHGRFPTLSVVV
jgi:hypothetical protein